MPDPDRLPEIRASDADREWAADRLRIAAGEGRLDADELDERLSAAYAAKYCTELVRLTADVTPAPRPAPRPVFVRSSRSPNGLAVASLITGLVWGWWVGSVLAIVMGHVALRQIERSEGRQSGRGMAMAGLALGYLGVSILLVTLLAVAVT
jgi:hypothetical protein